MGFVLSPCLCIKHLRFRNEIFLRRLVPLWSREKPIMDKKRKPRQNNKHIKLCNRFGGLDDVGLVRIRIHTKILFPPYLEQNKWFWTSLRGENFVSKNLDFSHIRHLKLSHSLYQSAVWTKKNSNSTHRLQQKGISRREHFQNAWWEWQSGDGDWKKFPWRVCEKLNKLMISNDKSKGPVKYSHYDIDPFKKSQTNRKTHNVRKVRILVVCKIIIMIR